MRLARLRGRRADAAIAVGTGEDDITVVAEASDGAEAVRLARELRLDGLAATKQIVERLPDVRVIILTTFDLDDYVYGSLRAGASGFLVKDTEPAELVHVVRGGSSSRSPARG